MNDYHLSEDFFWAGSKEETARTHLRHRENVVLEVLVRAFVETSNPGAVEHLRGCAQRCQMMQMARLDILEACEGERPTIDPYEATRLNLYLNSFYINLLGGLDNLSWATTHQLGLKAPVDETDWKTRRFCTPSNREFIDALKQSKPVTGELLDEMQPWLIDLKQFRDPAAHRKPLSLPRGILTEDEGRQFTGLSKEASQTLVGDSWDEYYRLTAEADALGRFVPLIDGPRAKNHGYLVAPEQMASDRRQFNDFAFTLVTDVFGID